MKKLYINSSIGYVNMYLNDIFMLKKSIDNLIKH